MRLVTKALPSFLAVLQVELKSQEAQGLQEQRDQCLSHLQQYAAAYQQHLVAYEQLTSEKEAIHKQLLLQTQLMDQLQHEEVQGKMAAELARQELQEAQVRQLLRLGPGGGPGLLCAFSLFPGPIGAPKSYQPGEPTAPSPAEPLGPPWGR